MERLMERRKLCRRIYGSGIIGCGSGTAAMLKKA
jgi:hypothetical protein